MRKWLLYTSTSNSDIQRFIGSYIFKRSAIRKLKKIFKDTNKDLYYKLEKE